MARHRKWSPWEKSFYSVPFWVTFFLPNFNWFVCNSCPTCLNHCPSRNDNKPDRSELRQFLSPSRKKIKTTNESKRDYCICSSPWVCTPASGWHVQPLQCSVIPGTPHTPKRSIYGGRIPAAWSRKSIISQRYSWWWICQWCLCIPMVTSPLSKELWCRKKKEKHCKLEIGWKKRKWRHLETPHPWRNAFIPISSSTVTTLVTATRTTCICSHTALDSVKQLHLCTLPPAEMFLILNVMIISVNNHSKEFHLKRQSFSKRCRLNCWETYCLWITRGRNNTPGENKQMQKMGVWWSVWVRAFTKPRNGKCLRS